MSFPTFSLPQQLLAAVIWTAAMFCAGVTTGWHEHHLRTDAQQLGAARQQMAAAAAEARDLAAMHVSQDRVTTRTVTRYIERARAVQEVTRTLTERIPVYVPQPVDTGVPVGFVRLFNAGAQGLPPVPDAAGRADDAPSGLALSAVLRATLDNDGECIGEGERGDALRDWLDAQRALVSPPH
jgi:FAD/FMN-containing dehydrogenase